MITIDDIQENALASFEWYSRLNWDQFLNMAGQAYIKLYDALNRRMDAIPYTGKWIDAGVDVTRWDEITVAMDRYARTSVPAWMYDCFQEYVEDVLEKAENR